MDAPRLARLDDDLRRLADGDRSAFGPVFSALWPLLRAYAARALGDGPDAEDVAQGALLKLFDQVGDYDPSRRALPWALAIVAWECRTVRRRRTRAKELLDPKGSEDVGAGVASAEPSPEGAAIDRELVQLARDALAELSVSDRQTLTLAFGDAFAERAGASEPGVGAAALRKRKERAIERLRAAFRRLYGSF